MAEARTLYIVQGAAGKAGSRDTWVVRGFFDRSPAEFLRDWLEGKARELGMHHSQQYDFYAVDKAKPAMLAIDPAALISYPGLSYTVTECPVVDSSGHAEDAQRWQAFLRHSFAQPAFKATAFAPAAATQQEHDRIMNEWADARLCKVDPIEERKGAACPKDESSTPQRQRRVLYLCGPINGRTDADAKVWRSVVEDKWDGETLNPMRRDYRGRELEPGIAEEIVRGDLEDINNSDAILVFFDKPSVGTAMEIFYAKFFLGMFVAVINASGQTLSPWLVHHSDVQTSDVDSALAAIDKHLTERAQTPAAPPPNLGAASAAIDRAAEAYRVLDGLLASWFPALGRERQALVDILNHLSDASAALGRTAHAAALACQNKQVMGEHACANRTQCWEPCGQLGHSEEHARVSRPEDQRG